MEYEIKLEIPAEKAVTDNSITYIMINNEVIVEKAVSTSLEVSGYPILLLIGMIGVVGLIITHNLKKK